MPDEVLPVMRNRCYYTLKPYMPRGMQVWLRRLRIGRQLRRAGNCWPVLEEAGAAPPAWPGWPGGKRFALVLVHDVESAAGLASCECLAALEEERGIRSAFAFVPLRYQTPERLRGALAGRGFEILVHGLLHDGREFRDRPSFQQRRGPMNRFLADWNARGFSSPSSLHNLAWIGELDIDYDISTYDVDPFEPQPCGVGRIFPFWVQPPGGAGRGFLELPYTLPQDFTLFVLMREPGPAIWKRKLDWIAEKGGMALLKAHPDYMLFGGRSGSGQYPAGYYTDFLDYVRDRYGDRVWIARPSEIARYWRELPEAGTRCASPIPLHPNACATCRQAHALGSLADYPPSS